MLKFIKASLMWYRVKAYAFSLMEIKWWMWKSLFWGFFQLILFEQCGMDKWDIAEVTLAYLNITDANFQQDPYSHI